jgi:hypothetical protein
MSELDLLNLARSATQNEVAWFSQMITINFAMVVAIYYFLTQAKLALKVFSFVAYMIGSLIFLGEMLMEGNVKYGALNALRALPTRSIPTQQYLGVLDSWLAIVTAIVFNASFWILWIGIFYLLFHWKKSDHQRDENPL